MKNAGRRVVSCPVLSCRKVRPAARRTGQKFYFRPALQDRTGQDTRTTAPSCPVLISALDAPFRHWYIDESSALRSS